MLDMLGRGYIRASIWLKCKVQDIKETEVGISGIVAAVVLVLIAIGLGAIFWDRIKALVGEIFDNATQNKDSLNTKINSK